MRTVILTRPLPVTDGVANELTAANIPHLSLPSMQVCARFDVIFEHILQDNWHSYDGIMFVSQHAVNFAAERLKALQLTLPDAIWLAAVGQTTAHAAQAHWPNADIIVPPSDLPQDSEGLWTTLSISHPVRPGQRVLIVRAQEGRQTFCNYVQHAGATVDIWPCYERTRMIWTNAQITTLHAQLHNTGLVLSITSKDGLNALLDNLSDWTAADKRLLLQQPVLTLHSTIAQHADTLGFQTVHIEPANEAATHLIRLAQA